MKDMSFEPIWDAQAKILILGTYPSPLSRQQGFYYGHPRNRFWPLLSALLGCPLPQSVPEKKALLLRHQIALWDVLDNCTITGASDASITDPVPNDVASLMRRSGVQQVFANGKKAQELYQRFCTACPPCVCLPSTSPANAQYSFERLLGAWSVILEFLPI